MNTKAYIAIVAKRNPLLETDGKIAVQTSKLRKLLEAAYEAGYVSGYSDGRREAANLNFFGNAFGFRK